MFWWFGESCILDHYYDALACCFNFVYDSITTFFMTLDHKHYYKDNGALILNQTMYEDGILERTGGSVIVSYLNYTSRDSQMFDNLSYSGLYQLLSPSEKLLFKTAIVCTIMIIFGIYALFLSFLWNFLSGENERNLIKRKREKFSLRQITIDKMKKE